MWWDRLWAIEDCNGANWSATGAWNVDDHELTVAEPHRLVQPPSAARRNRPPQLWGRSSGC